jgi:hypothetical protein
MKQIPLLILILPLSVGSALAGGTLNYSATPATYQVVPGGMVDLIATLRNVGDAVLYVNDVSLSPNGSGVSYLTPNPFFNFSDSIPGTFQTRDTAFVGSLGELLVDPSTPFGVYMVTVGIIGGSSPSLVSLTDVIGTQTFTIFVSPSVAGGFPQVVSGSGWNTTIALTNTSANPVTGQITFYRDNGNSLTLPLAFPQFGLTATVSSQSFTLNPNASFVIETGTPPSLTVGWAAISANGALSGYSIFRFGRPGAADSEGKASLDTPKSFLAFPCDNTNDHRTGLALANESSSSADLTAILRDQNGLQLASSHITLPALGHTAFFVDELFPVSRNQLEVIEFQSSGTITGIALRFSPSGSFTSVPGIQ